MVLKKDYFMIKNIIKKILMCKEYMKEENDIMRQKSLYYTFNPYIKR